MIDDDTPLRNNSLVYTVNFLASFVLSGGWMDISTTYLFANYRSAAVM
jgi:hypothetical protein